MIYANSVQTADTTLLIYADITYLLPTGSKHDVIKVSALTGA